MLRISLPWFTVAFSLSYIVIFALDMTLFLYYPVIGELHVKPLVGAAAGPAMHWYGLVASAAIVGLVVSVIGRDRWIPQTLGAWLWIAPASAMVVSVYLLLQFFV